VKLGTPRHASSTKRGTFAHTDFLLVVPLIEDLPFLGQPAGEPP